MSESERVQHYIRTMSGILGEDITQKSRRARLVWGRTMVAYQLLQENMTSVKIGRYMQMNHSSISHLADKMFGAFSMPTMYLDELIIWYEFKNRIS